MKEFLYGPTELCEVDNKERSAVFEISNDEINRRNIVNRTYGIDYSEYAKDPTVLFSHVPELYVGRAAWPVKLKRIDERNAKMLSKVMFGKSDFAEKIRLDVEDENSGLKHASIGIDPVEEFYFDEAEKAYKEDYERKPKKKLFKYNRSSKMGEWSIVPLAANVTADVEGYALNSGYIREIYASLDTSLKNAAVIAILDQYIDRMNEIENKIEMFFKSRTESSGQHENPSGASAGMVSHSTGVVSLEDLERINNNMKKILKG